jgi:signal transduction histidine kinase
MSRLEARVTGPEAAAIVAAARHQVLEALEELRAIIRGVHPPALDDGLPTALATLAARGPLPADLHDRLHHRPTDAQAAALYFTAAELLTNVAGHAEADNARVDISDTSDGIRLVVRDNGRGGASPSSAGTGLAGVERRIRALDGTMTVDSPPNGPTTHHRHPAQGTAMRVIVAEDNVVLRDGIVSVLRDYDLDGVGTMRLHA